MPGVSFYRTTSKQLIQPGELLAESDDDVDEYWLAQTQGRALEDLGITGAAKDFTRAFNQHLAREQSDSSLLVRDALIRFARSYKEEFRDVGWQRLFRAKLNQLRSVGIIADEIVTFCVHLIQAEREDGTRVLGEEAASAGAERFAAQSSRTHASDASWKERQVNVGYVNPRRRDSKTPVEGRSTSPENGQVVQRERKRWTGGKPVPRDVNLPNGTAPRKPTDHPREEAGAANGVATHERRKNSGGATFALHGGNHTCTCGKPAKDTRGTIACADPVWFPVSKATNTH